MGKIIKNGDKKDKFEGGERRKSMRRPILDSFGFFVTVPAKGGHRLPIHDVSEHGVGFDLDIEGEGAEGFPLSQGEVLEVHLYLNQSLYIPIKVRTARVTSTPRGRAVGAEFEKLTGASAQAVANLVKMLDSLNDIAKLVS